jgi:PHD/YefM family antitoxin component YafN of YafNO toxin-antitoxin module
MSKEDLESIEETLAVLSDPEQVPESERSIRDGEAGRTVPELRTDSESRRKAAT